MSVPEIKYIHICKDACIYVHHVLLLQPLYYIYTHVYIYMLCISIHISICRNIHIYIYIIFIYICICIYIYTCICNIYVDLYGYNMASLCLSLSLSLYLSLALRLSIPPFLSPTSSVSISKSSARQANPSRASQSSKIQLKDGQPKGAKATPK